MVKNVLSKIHEIVTYEEIDNQISRLNNESYWYKQSYSQFLKRFKETRGEVNSGVWAERVALVYSWLPKIPLKSFLLDADVYKPISIDRQN